MVTGSIRDTLPLDGQRWLDTITQARHDPVTLLDSLEGGYVLGLALAVAMPIVRAALDASIYKVGLADPRLLHRLRSCTEPLCVCSHWAGSSSHTAARAL